jgi:hypothetical protein
MPAPPELASGLQNVTRVSPGVARVPEMALLVVIHSDGEATISIDVFGEGAEVSDELVVVRDVKDRAHTPSLPLQLDLP